MDSYEKLKNIIDVKGDFKSVKVLDNRNTLLMMFETETPEQLYEKLSSYIIFENPQILKFHFKVNTNSRESFNHTLDFRTSEPIQGAPVPIASAEPVNIDEIVNGKVNEIIERKMYENEKAEFSEKRKEFETLAGKLSIFVEVLASKLLAPQGAPQNTKRT
jgi:hypothetical protein